MMIELEVTSTTSLEVIKKGYEAHGISYFIYDVDNEFKGTPIPENCYYEYVPPKVSAKGYKLKAKMRIEFKK